MCKFLSPISIVIERCGTHSVKFQLLFQSLNRLIARDSIHDSPCNGEEVIRIAPITLPAAKNSRAFVRGSMPLVDVFLDSSVCAGDDAATLVVCLRLLGASEVTAKQYGSDKLKARSKRPGLLRTNAI